MGDQIGVYISIGIQGALEKVIVPVLSGIVPLVVVLIAHCLMVRRQKSDKQSRAEIQVQFFLDAYASLLGEIVGITKVWKGTKKYLSDLNNDARNIPNVKNVFTFTVINEFSTGLYESLVLGEKDKFKIGITRDGI